LIWWQRVILNSDINGLLNRKQRYDFSCGSKMNSSLIHNHLLDAWKLTTHAIKIRRFNFFGSLIDTLILSEILLIQISHVWLDILGKSSQFFSWVRDTGLNIL